MLNEKIVRLTREKTEQEVGFKKMMESLELIKNSEVSNVKESYRYVSKTAVLCVFSKYTTWER